jgi:pSer/pThr/pTyr-binding forkhead associated (FHA) protein
MLIHKLVLPLANGQTQEFVLADSVATLGRDSANDIVIADERISKRHARLECTQDSCTLIDLSSANGTRVNGKPVRSVALNPGDVITVGNTTLTIESGLEEQDSGATVVDRTQPESAVDENTISIQIQNNKLPRLLVRCGESTREVVMQEDALTIGRALDNDVVVSMPHISRHHARLARKGRGFILRDLNSDNGTWVGRCRIAEAQLQHGDSFRIGAAEFVFKHAFAPDDLTSGEYPLGEDSRFRRPIVIVPGFGGSKLWRGSEQVWPGWRALLNNIDLLKFDEQAPLEARGLVDEVVIIPNLIKLERYSQFSEYLQSGLGYERGRDLLEFAYDFRQDIRTSARVLGTAIENWHVPRPVTIIAHSMGCLVSRYYVDRLGGHKHVGRLILIGGPHAGVPKAFVTLFTGPKLLPLGLLDSQLRQALVTFPSSYQILPRYSCVSDQKGGNIDLFADASWLADKHRALLRYGKELREGLTPEPRSPSVCIFGYGLKTITGVVVGRKSEVCDTDSIVPVIEPKGDGTIPERSAIMRDCEIHPVRQYHGTLFLDNDVKMRLKLELMRAAA